MNPLHTARVAVLLVLSALPGTALARHHAAASHHHAATRHERTAHHAEPKHDAAPSGATRVPAGGLKIFCPGRSSPLLVRKMTQGNGTTVTVLCR